MQYLNLEKRKLEPEDVMEDSEAIEYLKAHKFNPKHKGNVYWIACTDLFDKVNVESGRVLDVGCGYGAFILRMQYFKPNLKYFGVDLSEAMIHLARRNANADFFVASAENLPFPDNYFSIVVCKDTFHHFDKPANVLKEMFRVTKPGGKIYITDLRRDSSEEVILQVIQELCETNFVNASQYVDSIKASYNIAELKTLLKKAGIKSYRIWKPTVSKDFCEKYSIKPNDFLSAKNFMLDRWNLLISK